MPITFPYTPQHDAMDCGPACLRMLAKYYGKNYSLNQLRNWSSITREGVSLLGISEAAERIGFKTLAVKTSLQHLHQDAPLPFVAHWRQNHFVVVYKIKKKFFSKEYVIYIADPAAGKIKLPQADFEQSWCSDTEQGQKQGVALLFETTPAFYEQEEDKTAEKRSLRLLPYLRPYKKLLFQLALGMFAASVIQILFPYLTQSIVDHGINFKDLKFIYLVLAGQLMLTASNYAIEFVRSWILIHISGRIRISLISDFLIKLMKLPMWFFDTKMTGDILQRINDHHRIESFLTASTLNTLFSGFSFIIFGIILFTYNTQIFALFMAASVLYVLWVLLFLKKRKELDYRYFNRASANQSAIIQLVTGMQEIKLHNAETIKRWEWERIQGNLFKLSLKTLGISQMQQGGAAFINELKNVLITVLTASLVIKGELSLGMMLAIQYIIGQLNAPVQQFIQFIQLAQDAKISMDRLNEIHTREEEANEEQNLLELGQQSIQMEELCFRYGAAGSPLVLDHINLNIEAGKVTAIVGASGSGKTTLIKLLMKYYEDYTGKINIGAAALKFVSGKAWRAKIGAVMQDGFIFSDTIARNIAPADEIIDKKKLLKAVEIANIREFIESLPLGYNTKIGQEGVGISQGQKQRMLIARAVYKNPDYMFFDEATNALDAENERKIVEKLAQFYADKTVVIVAHRLSTVKNADKIVVLKNGKVIEQGTHQELTNLKGAYYNLVKNQLELGN